eukprot:UN01531
MFMLTYLSFYPIHDCILIPWLLSRTTSILPLLIIDAVNIFVKNATFHGSLWTIVVMDQDYEEWLIVGMIFALILLLLSTACIYFQSVSRDYVTESENLVEDLGALHVISWIYIFLGELPLCRIFICVELVSF